MVIPIASIGAVVSAATGVKKWSRGQGLFLVSVKQSIFKLGNSGQLGQDAFARDGAHCVVKCGGQAVKVPFAVRSSGQPAKTIVKYFDPGRSCHYNAYAYGSDHPA